MRLVLVVALLLVVVLSVSVLFWRNSIAAPESEIVPLRNVLVSPMGEPDSAGAPGRFRLDPPVAGSRPSTAIGALRASQRQVPSDAEARFGTYTGFLEGRVR